MTAFICIPGSRLAVKRIMLKFQDEPLPNQRKALPHVSVVVCFCYIGKYKIFFKTPFGQITSLFTPPSTCTYFSSVYGLGEATGISVIWLREYIESAISRLCLCASQSFPSAIVLLLA